VEEMAVVHERVTGLDVHKETIVACVRIMAGRRATRECRTFDGTMRSWRLADVADEGRVHPCGDGSDRGDWVWNILSDDTFEADAGTPAKLIHGLFHTKENRPPCRQRRMI
jgi:transposase